jgi:hypothetical protein
VNNCSGEQVALHATERRRLNFLALGKLDLYPCASLAMAIAGADRSLTSLHGVCLAWASYIEWHGLEAADVLYSVGSGTVRPQLWRQWTGSGS